MMKFKQKDETQCEGSYSKACKGEFWKFKDSVKALRKELWEEIGRNRSHVLRQKRDRQIEKVALEAKLAGSDFPLSFLAKDFDLLVKEINELICNEFVLTNPGLLSLSKELIRLHRRTKDMLTEFSVFYCTRLVLDKQSPLATQFMDFFCDLQWLLLTLMAQIDINTNGSGEVAMPWHYMYSEFSLPSTFIYSILIERCYACLASLRPLVYTCVALHCLFKLSCDSSRDSIFQREVSYTPRMFTHDLYHCLSRSFGNLADWDLDFYKDIRVEIEEELLGEGGFASVCKGHFIRTLSGEKIGDPVAIKMVLERTHDLESSYASSSFFSSSSETRDTLGFSQLMDSLLSMSDLSFTSSSSKSQQVETPHVSELQKLVSLQHPNILGVKGYIANRELNNGKVAKSGIVMELMDESLDKSIHLMQQNGVPVCKDVLALVDLMLEVARAIRFLHENRVTHRDLKPANILLRRIYISKYIDCIEVKVGDFGLTKYMSESKNAHIREHTACVGTTGYMAPELRVFNHKVTYTDKVDVYGYGMTCLDVITGMPDYEVRSGKYKDLYNAIADGEWKDWVKYMMPYCPEDLINLIGSCLKLDPYSRPSFAEICFHLQQFKRKLLLLELEHKDSRNFEDSDKINDAGESTYDDQLRTLKALSFGKVVFHGLLGSELMNSLIDRIPESTHTSVKAYFQFGENHWRNDIQSQVDLLEKQVKQHDNWKNEVLSEAITNVILMKDSSDFPTIIQRSKKMICRLENLCSGLMEDLFSFEQKSSSNKLLKWVNLVVNQHPHNFLDFKGLKNIYGFGDIVDSCFGVMYDGFTSEEIESMRGICSRKYLLYHGFFCPYTKSEQYSRDVLLDFQAKWLKHEITCALLRWSWTWKKSQGVAIPLPWDENVIDYTLVFNNPSSPQLTFEGYFDLSLSISLKACKPPPSLNLIDDNASGPFDEDESMLPLLKSFHSCCINSFGSYINQT